MFHFYELFEVSIFIEWPSQAPLEEENVTHVVNKGRHTLQSLFLSIRGQSYYCFIIIIIIINISI